MNSPISQMPQICVPAPKLGFPSPIVSLPNQTKKRAIPGSGMVKCAKESADKIWMDKEEKELLKKWSEKCQETGGGGGGAGIVALMECLEREAIMGEDEGREAIDYNRRALIFDKSAKVFQALKQQTTS